MNTLRSAIAFFLIYSAHALQLAAANPVQVSIDWTEVLATAKTTATMQVIPNAQSRRGRPFHQVTFDAIKQIDAKYTRYLIWGPYPKLQIAALHPPTSTTSWDFSLIDPELLDFLNATEGREPVVNFSSVPYWMLHESNVSYPNDPNQATWQSYFFCSKQRPQLKDPSGQQLADYYVRIMKWYTQGGFTDENGRYHHSGHKYEFPWWGVLNEYDFLGPKQYTIVYDRIVSALRKVSPKTRFVALELASVSPEFLEYFLDARNHQPGIPIDMIAYHFYALPNFSETLEHWQYSFFHQADMFLYSVSYIESIRKRLAPDTLTYVDELGSMLPSDMDKCGSQPTDIPPLYWNLSAALYAYMYLGFTKLGIDAAGQAGFSFYPGNFPSVSMVNWDSGELNARFHVLRLLNDHFSPGDKLVATTVGKSLFQNLEDVAAQAFETSKGKKLLLINKRSQAVNIRLNASDLIHRIDSIEQASGGISSSLEGARSVQLSLGPFEVALVTIHQEDSPRVSKR